MIIDTAVPKGNENELIKAAEHYGIETLYLLYDKKIPAQKFDSKIKIVKVLIADDFKSIPKTPNCPVFFDFSKSDYRQDIFAKIDFAFNLEQFPGKDKIKTYESALDDATAKIAKQHKVSILFNLSQITDRKSRRILSRAYQNFNVATKYRLPFTVCSFATKPEEIRNPKDRIAFQRIYFK